MKILTRLRSAWTIYWKTREISRCTRWLACDARLDIRMQRLRLRDEEFAWEWYMRNTRRMQALHDRWKIISPRVHFPAFK